MLVTVVMAPACGGSNPVARRSVSLPPELGSTPYLTTGREDLARTIAEKRQILTERNDLAAAVQLAEALLRQSRVTGNGGLANDAERALLDASATAPDAHALCRMLAAVHVSQHRFADGRAKAEQCLLREPGDIWLLGVIADASIELGDYDAAWTTIDAMIARRPNAAAYARASYARELQGDLTGALELMQMALSATPPFDIESVAWHHAQLGQLYLQLGRIDDASTAFAHADYVFPDHPDAIAGRTAMLAARGHVREALRIWTTHVSASPAPDKLARLGDLHAALAETEAAERAYALAEAAWMTDAPEPTRLSRFLADRGRRIDVAVDLARQELKRRHDIFTEDAYAWASYRAGRLDEARAAIARALRTDSRDAAIRYHAAAIAAASGDHQAAHRHLMIVLRSGPIESPLLARDVLELQRSLSTGTDR